MKAMHRVTVTQGPKAQPGGEETSPPRRVSVFPPRRVRRDGPGEGDDPAALHNAPGT